MMHSPLHPFSMTTRFHHAPLALLTHSNSNRAPSCHRRQSDAPSTHPHSTRPPTNFQSTHKTDSPPRPPVPSRRDYKFHSHCGHSPARQLLQNARNKSDSSPNPTPARPPHSPA